MSVSKLIEKFSQLTTLPVEVSAIEDELRLRGLTDEIYYWKDVDLPSEHMKGYIERWDWEDANAGVRTACVDITYGHMPPDYERLVCGKELLHILDPADSKVQTEKDLNRQIKKIILPSNVQDAFSDTAHVVTDRQAIIQALAVLFPLEARNIIYDAHATGRVSLAKIAARAELPIPYVAIVMSEVWPEIHKLILTAYGS